MTEDLVFGQIDWWISWSPDGQQVVFGAGSDIDATGRYDHKLYIVNADGSGLRQLTRGESNDVDVSWSPDGEWIAFHRNCGLWAIRPDGSDRRRLLEGSDEFCVSLIVWSPDSQKLAFWNTHRNAPASELWVIDREGRDPRVVHSLEQPVDWKHAVWTPDGGQIVYWYGKDKEERAFRINPDGSGEPQAVGGETGVFRSWLPNYWPPWGGATKGPTDVPAPPPAIGDDRTMYDDFDNPANEGSYERGLWILAAEEEQVAQQDGVMTFRQQGQPRQGAELTSVKYHKMSLDRPIFFEARLMLSPEANAGDVHLDLRTELAPDETWYANCNIGNQEGKAWASCFNETIRHGQGDVVFSSEGKPVQFGDWHVVRIELDPATMTFRYLIDGQFVGSHAPADADRLREAGFTLSIGTYAPSAAALTGYVDDVQTGPLGVAPHPAVPDDPWGLFVFPPGSTVSIGLVADFSGGANWLGPVSEYAVQMAIEDRGPLKGFPVSALVVDGGCQEEMATAAAQTLIADPSVVGVVGHTCSKSCAAGMPLYEEAHLAMISPSCTGPDLSAQGYQVFNRVMIRDDQGGDERNEQIINTQVYQDFSLQYQRRFGQSLDSVDLSFVAAYAYDAASILLEAIERTAVVDASGSLIVGRQALIKAVRATPGYRGITGIIRFDDRGDRVP
jgi:ABC-type branched-subunit amino acid transport system substrate-binding protein